MATKVLTNAFVSLGGTDISAFVKSVEFTVEVDELEDTAMGDTARTRLGGLEDASLTLELYQEYGASGIEALLWTNKGTAVTAIIRPDSGSAAAANPQYTGTVLISQMHPISGGVGEVAMESVTFPATAAFARAVA